jgi:hypothetical protein
MQLTYKLRTGVKMLTLSEFNSWSASLGLSSQEYTMIQSIRSSPPSRRVRGSVGNVIGRYPSKKMGMVIQFELCNTRCIQRLPDIASIVVNALHDNTQAYKQC